MLRKFAVPALALLALPAIASAQFEAGDYEFTLAGTPGSRAEIEFSADLIHWESLETVVITGGSLVFADPAAGIQTRRFYRARFQP